MASLDSGETKRLLGANSGGIYASSGHLLFARDGTLLAQPFNPKTLQLSDEPFPVAEHVESSIFGGILAFSVSENGVLAYGTGTNTNIGALQLVWLDRQGKQIETAGPPVNYIGVDLAPDGKSFAAHRHEGRMDQGGGGDIWLLDGSRGTNLRFTFDASRENVSPIWSPDGTKIIYGAQRSGKWNLFQKASTGAGNEELLLESERAILPESWSPDGKSIVYMTNDVKTGDDLWLLPLSGNRKPLPLVNGPADQRYGQISPDGKWLAYRSNETGRSEVYVIPFPTGAGKWQVSNNGGSFPRWRRDSREVFYESLNFHLFAVEIKASESRLAPGTPKDLFESGLAAPIHGGSVYLPYAVSNDGQRFLIPRSVSQATENPAASSIVVVLNWTAAIKK